MRAAAAVSSVSAAPLSCGQRYAIATGLVLRLRRLTRPCDCYSFTAPVIDET